MTVASATAEVTKAQIGLTTAETQLGQATMRAPVSGTIASLPFAKGDSVSVGDKVIVQGKGAVEVDLSVGETAFGSLKVGQHAVISSPGTSPVPGVVSAHGLLPNTSSTSTAAFPVTVTATGPTAAQLPTGAVASVAITTATSPDAIVVPVSAITRNGSTGTVSVLSRGTVTTTPVRLGAVGPTTAAITSGLAVGDVVVLADHSSALPANSTNIRRLAGGGGFGGGGAAGGTGTGGTRTGSGTVGAGGTGPR